MDTGGGYELTGNTRGEIERGEGERGGERRETWPGGMVAVSTKHLHCTQHKVPRTWRTLSHLSAVASN